MISKKDLVQVAFAGPDATDTCKKIGKALSKNAGGCDIHELMKTAKTNRARVLYSLHRFNKLNLVENHYVFPKETTTSKKIAKSQVMAKFRYKKEIRPVVAKLLK